jgi:hypothetical protein
MPIEDPNVMCRVLLTCVADTQPQRLAEATAAYGAGGTCFGELPAGHCQEQCAGALEALTHAFGNRPACRCAPGELCAPPARPLSPTEMISPRSVGYTSFWPRCAADSDCRTLDRDRVCDRQRSLCVECRTDKHCEPLELHACVAPFAGAERECAECRSNAHCPAFAPFCSRHHGCVACRTRKDCPNEGRGFTCTRGSCRRCAKPPCREGESHFKKVGPPR